jgi:Bacterial SH3 domain
MKNLFFLAALFCSMTIAAQEDALHVAAKTGLNIREKPETTAKVLGKIPYGAKISLQEESGGNKQISTEGLTGYWRKVTYNNQTGYIIDTYLLPYPPPKTDTMTMKEYLAQISVAFGDSLIIDNGKMNNAEEGGSQLIKQLYKNGAEWHEFLGYEYNSMTYFIPGFTMQQAFLLVRLIPEFAGYIGVKDEFIMNSKKVNKKTRVYEYKIEKEVFGDTPWITRIKISFEDGAIYNFEMFQIDNQVVIFYGAGV